VYNVASSILGANCGVGGSLIKKTDYIYSKQSSNTKKTRKVPLG
jgi:hypothetical protein